MKERTKENKLWTGEIVEREAKVTRSVLIDEHARRPESGIHQEIINGSLTANVGATYSRNDFETCGWQVSMVRVNALQSNSVRTHM